MLSSNYILFISPYVSSTLQSTSLKIKTKAYSCKLILYLIWYIYSIIMFSSVM